MRATWKGGGRKAGKIIIDTDILTSKAVKVNLNLDSKPYYSKDDAKREYGIIRKRLTMTQDFDLARLPVAVCNGYTFAPAAMTGTSGDSWQSQQIFCADIDNEDGGTMTPTEAIEKMTVAGISPSFLYYSFSHTEERPRFRVVVAADREITDPAQADRMRKGLIALFPGADIAAADPARMFLGTNKGLALEYTGATTPAGTLEALYYERVEPKQAEITQAPRPSYTYDKGNDLTRAIEEFDLIGYISRTTNSIPKQIGGQVRFNPCPICGGHDDFDVKGSIFTCRSDKGLKGGGGNIINYLEALHGWSRQTAREYFMYDILGWDRAERKQQYKETKRQELAQRVTQAPVSDTGSVPDFVIEIRNKNGEVTKRYISCPKLAQTVREHEHYIFCRDAAMTDVQRFWYSGGYYHFVSDDEIRGIIKGYIDRYDPTLLRMKDVDEVFRILATDRVFHTFSELNGDERLVNFQDGVLDLTTGHLMPHDPKYLMTRQIPVNYNDPRAKDEPVNFHRYMARLCYGRDEYEPPFDGPGGEKYTVLMQFLAVAMSNIKGYRFKKSLFMYGPGDTGKSQLKALAEYLIGAENCTACDLSQLEARFGTSTIFNKRLIGSSDMPYITVDELDVFKKLTGGDALFAEYKGKNGFSFTFDGLSWFCTNRLPRFGGDRGEWVYQRILPVECPHVVPEEQRDRRLLDKMKLEAPAIVHECVVFLHMLIVTGKYQFDEPSETATIRKTYTQDNDSLAAWLAEYCVEVSDPGPEWATVLEFQDDHDAPTVTALYKIYRDWCREYENGYALKLKDFKAEIVTKYGPATKRRSGLVFTGICLKNEYKQEASIYNCMAPGKITTMHHAG